MDKRVVNAAPSTLVQCETRIYVKSGRNSNSVFNIFRAAHTYKLFDTDTYQAVFSNWRLRTYVAHNGWKNQLFFASTYNISRWYGQSGSLYCNILLNNFKLWVINSTKRSKPFFKLMYNTVEMNIADIVLQLSHRSL